MTSAAPQVRSRQGEAIARAEKAQRLRAENPDMTLEEIGAECGGISKQRVSQLLKNPPQGRWPDELVAAMVAALKDGKSPADLLEIDGVAERIKARRPRGVLLAEAEATVRARQTSSLRKLISTGADAPAGTVARQLFDARQAGLTSTIKGWPAKVFASVRDALARGAKYAEVLAEVPNLLEYLVDDDPEDGRAQAKAATTLRVITDSGETAPAGSRARQLFDARQAAELAA